MGRVRRFHPEQGEIHPEVRQAGVEGMSLAPEAAAPMIARASLHLRGLFRTREPVLMVPGPTDLLRELILRNAVENRALVLVSGPQGEALATRAEALGKEVIRLVVPKGRAVEPHHLARFLEGPVVDSVVLAHAELGTGVINPLPELADVVRQQRDVLLLVDAQATLGASPLETDQWGLDAALASSSGPLGLQPGLGFAALSPRLVERVGRQSARGTELDLVSHWTLAARGQLAGALAPSIAAMFASQMARIIETEGLERRWQRHAALRTMMDAWAEEAGIPLVARAGRRAEALSCLMLGEGVTAGTVADRLEAHGIVVGLGHGEDAGGHLRVGHMGEVEPADLTALLELLRQIIRS